MNERADCLFKHDDKGRITFANEAGGARAPRFFLGRAQAGVWWRCRDDLPAPIVAQIDRLCRDEPIDSNLREPPRHAECYRALLQTHQPIEREWSGPVYPFPRAVTSSPGELVAITRANADLLAADFRDWLADVGRCNPLLALVHEGRVVSLCASVRITPAIHEAGMETLPAERGRGFAGAVVGGWARAVRELGAEPLYSTSWENTASQAVARKLGLLPFGADFHLT